jgi:hypothetical protein
MVFPKETSGFPAFFLTRNKERRETGFSVTGDGQKASLRKRDLAGLGKALGKLFANGVTI